MKTKLLMCISLLLIGLTGFSQKYSITGYTLYQGGDKPIPFVQIIILDKNQDSLMRIGKSAPGHKLMWIVTSSKTGYFKTDTMPPSRYAFIPVQKYGFNANGTINSLAFKCPKPDSNDLSFMIAAHGGTTKSYKDFKQMLFNAMNVVSQTGITPAITWNSVLDNEDIARETSWVNGTEPWTFQGISFQPLIIDLGEKNMTGIVIHGICIGKPSDYTK